MYMFCFCVLCMYMCCVQCFFMSEINIHIYVFFVFFKNLSAFYFYTFETSNFIYQFFLCSKQPALHDTFQPLYVLIKPHYVWSVFCNLNSEEKIMSMAR